MVVLSKDAIALATLNTIEQEALVVVFGGHLASLYLLDDAIQMPFVTTTERNYFSARIL